MTGRWPAISARSAGGAVDLLAVVDGFADAHVEHDLLEPRDLHAVLVAELLRQRLAHHLLVVRLHARLVVLRARRRQAAAALPSAAFLSPLPSLGLAALGSLAAARRALRACRGLCRFLFVSHDYFFSGMTSPERLAKRTFLPSSRNLKPTRVGLPSLGSSSARFERWIGASLEMMPPSWLRRLALVPAHDVDAAHQRAALLRAAPRSLRPACPCRGRRAR